MGSFAVENPTVCTLTRKIAVPTTIARQALLSAQFADPTLDSIPKSKAATLNPLFLTVLENLD